MKTSCLSTIVLLFLCASCEEVPPVGNNPLEAPVTTISVNFVSENAAIINWHDNTLGTSHYRIERLDPGAKDYKLRTETVIAATQFVDSFLVQTNISYFYRIQTIDQMNSAYYTKPFESWLTFWPPAQMKISTNSTSTIQLTWFYLHSFEKGFTIQQSFDGSSFTTIATTNFDNKGFVPSNLDTTKIYAYKIFAYSDYNISYPDSIRVQYKNSLWQDIGWQGFHCFPPNQSLPAGRRGAGKSRLWLEGAFGAH